MKDIYELKKMASKLESRISSYIDTYRDGNVTSIELETLHLCHEILVGISNPPREIDVRKIAEDELYGEHENLVYRYSLPYEGMIDYAITVSEKILELVKDKMVENFLKWQSIESPENLLSNTQAEEMIKFIMSEINIRREDV